MSEEEKDRKKGRKGKGNGEPQGSLKSGTRHDKSRPLQRL